MNIVDDLLRLRNVKAAHRGNAGYNSYGTRLGTVELQASTLYSISSFRYYPSACDKVSAVVHISGDGVGDYVLVPVRFMEPGDAPLPGFYIPIPRLRELIEEQADEDWTTFLNAMDQELNHADVVCFKSGFAYPWLGVPCCMSIVRQLEEPVAVIEGSVYMEADCVVVYKDTATHQFVTRLCESFRLERFTLKDEELLP